MKTIFYPAAAGPYPAMRPQSQALLQPARTLPCDRSRRPYRSQKVTPAMRPQSQAILERTTRRA